MRTLTGPTFLSIAMGAGACSLIVDSEIREDRGFQPIDDLGVGTFPCTLDTDCANQFGARSMCVRNRCFDLGQGCARTERVNSSIETDTTWWPDTCYELGTTVYVRNGATLTIERGTRITGLEDETALVVTRSGRIDARGSPSDPIVMTSGQVEGMRVPGDWGGLAMLGRAPINGPGEDFLEGLPQDENARYGDIVAPDPDHDCGTLRYVRIEFAGFEVANNNELNGLTLGGCGQNTRIEYVQVHYGSDDGIEVFGGTVGLQWVVISRAQDDSLDWDQGWRGFAQFLVVLQDEPRPDLDANIYTGGDNGFEADSLSDTDPGTPRSRPRLYNVTMVGSREAGSRTRGMLLREGTSAELRNFLVTGYVNGLWDVEDLTADCFRSPPGPSCTETGEQVLVEGLLLHDMGPDGTTWVVPDAPSDDDDDGFDEVAYVNTSTIGALVFANPFLVQPSLSEPRTLDLRPVSTSPADISRQNPRPFSDRPEQVQVSGRNYLGAFRPGGENWMAGWTAFPEN